MVGIEHHLCQTLKTDYNGFRKLQYLKTVSCNSTINVYRMLIIADNVRSNVIIFSNRIRLVMIKIIVEFTLGLNRHVIHAVFRKKNKIRMAFLQIDIGCPNT